MLHLFLIQVGRIIKSLTCFKINLKRYFLIVFFIALSLGFFCKSAQACYYIDYAPGTSHAQILKFLNFRDFSVNAYAGFDGKKTFTTVFVSSSQDVFNFANQTIVTTEEYAKYVILSGNSIGVQTVMFEWAMWDDYSLNGYCYLTVTVEEPNNLIIDNPLASTCTSSPCKYTDGTDYTIAGGISVNGGTPQKNVNVGQSENISVFSGIKLNNSGFGLQVKSFTTAVFTFPNGQKVTYQKNKDGNWVEWDSTVETLDPEVVSRSNLDEVLINEIYSGDPCSLPKGDYIFNVGYCPEDNCSEINYNTEGFGFNNTACSD